MTVDALTRLAQILQESRIDRYSDVESLPKRSRIDLDETVYAWFAAYREEIVAALKDQGGLNLCLPWADRYKAYDHDSTRGTLVKKIVTLSQSAVITVPPFRHPGVRAAPIPRSWYELTLTFWPLVSGGLLKVLPNSATHLVKYGGVDGSGRVVRRRDHMAEQNWVLLAERIPTLTPVSLDTASLNRQMHEIDPGLLTGAGNVYMFLPHLVGVPPEVLAKLRADHPAAFQLYNSTVQTMFEESKGATNEAKLMEILRRTDSEMRRVQTDLQRLVRAKSLEAVGAAVKVGMGVLCAFVPDPYISKEIKAMLVGLAGSGALNDLKSFVVASREGKTRIEADAFHFPWLVHLAGSGRQR